MSEEQKQSASIETPASVPTKVKTTANKGKIIIYLILIVFAAWGLPKILGGILKTDYPIAAITSGSMWPELKKGDLVLIQGVDPKTVQVDDIVVYTTTEISFTVHRVIELKAETLITKGDANNAVDQPVTYESIVGRVIKINQQPLRIPKLGFISIIFKNFVNN